MTTRYLNSTLAVILLIFTGCKMENVKHTSPPNILLIIADDAGWNDFSFNGSEIRTPNLDSLALQGVKLDRFYANPTCSPTRMSLLTGLPASRIGVFAPISGRSKKTLPDSLTTLPQALKKNNYQNALFGKWHLGLDLANGPNAFGFDYSYGFLHGQIDQYTHKYKNGDDSWYRNDKMIQEEGHATDLITQEAIEWMNSKRDSSKPFFIQLAYSAPHFPLQEEERWKSPYRASIENDSRRDFAAAMSHMDHSIGLVLKNLRVKGLEENTLIIFMSDNGAMESWYPSDQYNGVHGPNDVLGSNYPLKDWKASNYEGAIRVPAIVYWKDILKTATNNNYISVTDLMPTLLSLIETEVPDDVEGVNVWPSIVDQTNRTSHVIYVRGHKQESLISQPWKIIRQRFKNNQPTEYYLFNIENDPEEKINLIEKELEIFKKMKELLQGQFSKDDNS